MRTSLFAASLLLLPACALDQALIDALGLDEKGGSEGPADKDETEEETEEERDPYPDCGQFRGNHFYIPTWQVLYDPLDFYGESWDWDGGGIEDFYGEVDELVELLATIYGYGEYIEVVELLVPVAEDLAQLLMSPYVSPDPLTSLSYYDGTDVYEGWEEQSPEDQNLATVEDLEVNLTMRDELIFFDYYDVDVAFDDYVGYLSADKGGLQSFADCGPYVYVLTDAEMRDWDTRIRAFAFEVQSW